LVVLFPTNIVGAIVFIVEFILRIGWDGETLAERWSLIEVYGLWSLWAAGFLIHLMWKKSRLKSPISKPQ